MTLTVSVVTPTLGRPKEVAELLDNLGQQRLAPSEVILVDGAPAADSETEDAVARTAPRCRFACHHVRHGGGTAIQRNVGIELAHGDLIAFFDDDVRLDPEFLARVVELYEEDREGRLGAVVGYRKNKHFRLEEAARWRWWRRLGVLRCFEPGRYDFETGYPINANLQPPFAGVREVDFMTTACAVWRRQVFDDGLRFDPFFFGYGVLEDAHLSLRARRHWRLVQCGDALCEETSSPRGREQRGLIGYKCVVNYYYVFRDVAGPLSVAQRVRFWRFQLLELVRIGASCVIRRRRGDLDELGGRLRGIWAVLTGAAFRRDSGE